VGPLMNLTNGSKKSVTNTKVQKKSRKTNSKRESNRIKFFAEKGIQTLTSLTLGACFPIILQVEASLALTLVAAGGVHTDL